MGVCASKRTEKVEEVAGRTQFSPPEVSWLLERYEHGLGEGAKKSGKKLKWDVAEFTEQFELSEATGAKLFATFDKDKDNLLDFNEFVAGYALISKGHIYDKLQFLFNVYDKNQDGLLDRDEVAAMLLDSTTSFNSLLKALYSEKTGKQLPYDNASTAQMSRNESLKLIDAALEGMFAAADSDGDGMLNTTEFKAMMRDHLDELKLSRAFQVKELASVDSLSYSNSLDLDHLK